MRIQRRKRTRSTAQGCSATCFESQRLANLRRRAGPVAARQAADPGRSGSQAQMATNCGSATASSYDSRSGGVVVLVAELVGPEFGAVGAVGVQVAGGVAADGVAVFGLPQVVAGAGDVGVGDVGAAEVDPLGGVIDVSWTGPASRVTTSRQPVEPGL